jgi:hypothetical protein
MQVLTRRDPRHTKTLGGASLRGSSVMDECCDLVIPNGRSGALIPSALVLGCERHESALAIPGGITTRHVLARDVAPHSHQALAAERPFPGGCVVLSARAASGLSADYKPRIFTNLPVLT